MSPRERPSDRAARVADETLHALGRELRRARVGSGLSLRAVSAAADASHVEIGRIERGRSPNVPYRRLVRVAAVVGLDLPLRPYPSGDAIRDAAQNRLLDRLARRLHPSLRLRREVPLPIPGDRRAWDGVIEGRGWSVPVEAETRIDDVQALERKLALKRRDGGFAAIVLLVADTRGNRAALSAATEAFKDLRGDPVAALAALARGTHPDGGAVIRL